MKGRSCKCAAIDSWLRVELAFSAAGSSEVVATSIRLWELGARIVVLTSNINGFAAKLCAPSCKFSYRASLR
jgi:hypothetical protein